MARLGYSAELQAKHELIDAYGESNVLHTAIASMGADFIVLHPYKNEIMKVVEVKSTHRKKYYPSAREREQFARIRKFAKEHDIRAELWIKKPFLPFFKKEI